MASIQIPSERLEIVEDVDICVVGGSCTGLFAAVRAARQGARVALLEKQNRLGGTATCGMVGMWHSLYEFGGSRQVIGGLTFEMMERLEKRNAIGDFRNPTGELNIPINSEELTLELDALAVEHPGIRLYLQTAFSRVVMTDDGTITAVVAENHRGRFAIKAKYFIDCSGDGVLSREAGVEMRLPDSLQPPTTCARLSGFGEFRKIDLSGLMAVHRPEFPELPRGSWWAMEIPGSASFMLAGTGVENFRPDDRMAISDGELSTRRQLRAILDLLGTKASERKIRLEALPGVMALRESFHIVSRQAVSGAKLLHGDHPEDTIGHGTYPVDIHHPADDSIDWRYLSGRSVTYKNGTAVRESRWLPEGESLPCYHIPMRCMLPKTVRNLICAGRMLDADAEAFGALRVMVNLNQCGEAAGMAAWQALDDGVDNTALNFGKIRQLLAAGGSIIL